MGINIEKCEGSKKGKKKGNRRDSGLWDKLIKRFSEEEKEIKRKRRCGERGNRRNGWKDGRNEWGKRWKCNKKRNYGCGKRNRKI